MYGLLWKRCNWQGAIGGYSAGAITGVIGQLYFQLDFNLVTFITAVVTLLITPIISTMTEHPAPEKADMAWKARHISDEEILNNDVYHIIPRTKKGKLSLSLFVAGFILFLAGVLMRSTGAASASSVAVGGMILYFAAGLFRAYSD